MDSVNNSGNVSVESLLHDVETQKLQLDSFESQLRQLLDRYDVVIQEKRNMKTALAEIRAQCPSLGIPPVAEQHDYVDLGLPSRTCWATCNVGASSPEDFGDFFSWGEVHTKLFYEWETYFDVDGDGRALVKYNNKMGKKELVVADDVAAQQWGGQWRMPSYSHFRELVQKCEWLWTSVNGVLGYEVRSLKNGNHIFLPAAGYHAGEVHHQAVSAYGYYWSRSLHSDFSDKAFYLFFTPTDIRFYFPGLRPIGHSVRPVYSPII